MDPHIKERGGGTHATVMLTFFKEKTMFVYKNTKLSVDFVILLLLCRIMNGFYDYVAIFVELSKIMWFH